MPILEKSKEQLEYEREVELEEQARYDDVRAADRAHELALAERRHKRDVDIARLKHATQPRQAAIVRVLLGIVKLPALVVLAITVPFLVWRGRGVPEQLSNFFNL